MPRENQWKVLLVMAYFPQTVIIPRQYRRRETSVDDTSAFFRGPCRDILSRSDI